MTELSPSQKTGYIKIMCGFNVFLTGHAGTGKTYLLKKVIHDLEKAGKNVVVAAPTGVAAINIGGTTLHRLFMLKPDIYVGKKVQIPPVLKETDALIIDEISMCRVDLFDYVGRVLQAVQHSVHRSIQVVVVGDFCQLPPVINSTGNSREKEILDAYFGTDVGRGFAFISPQWNRLNFLTVELQEVMRQEDPAFIFALDRVRLGDATGLQYFAHNASRTALKDGIYLAGRNAEVDRINDMMLSRIEGDLFQYEASCEGDVTIEDQRVAPEMLELKIGARVMMTVNASDDEYHNGSIGVITALSEDCIMVKIDDGNECRIEENTWEIIQYETEAAPDDLPRFKRKVVGKYTQYPIKLAWAVTIHKSQGQTFSKVNLNPRCWDSGQLYVALSRLRSIDGLHLTAPLKEQYLQLDPAVTRFYEEARLHMSDDAGVTRDAMLPDETIDTGLEDSQNSLFW